MMDNKHWKRGKSSQVESQGYQAEGRSGVKASRRERGRARVRRIFGLAPDAPLKGFVAFLAFLLGIFMPIGGSAGSEVPSQEKEENLDMRREMELEREQAIRRRIRIRRWKRLMGGLAAVAVFITTYSMILPAITMERPLLCGLDAHTHEGACYTMMQVLTCGQVETGAHTHTEACYTDELILTCGKLEHSHSEACYAAQSTAGVETKEDWKKQFEEVELSGTAGERLVTVAKTQLGYRENEENYIVTEIGDIRGYTRYGGWMGLPYSNWNASFVSFCLEYAGINEQTFPGHEDSSASWAMELKGGQQQAGESTSSPETPQQHNHQVPAEEPAAQESQESQSTQEENQETQENQSWQDYPIDIPDLDWATTIQEIYWRDAKDYTPKLGDLVFFNPTGNGVAERVGIVAELRYDDGSVKSVNDEPFTEEQVEEKPPVVTDAASGDKAAESKQATAAAGDKAGETQQPAGPQIKEMSATLPLQAGTAERETLSGSSSAVTGSPAGTIINNILKGADKSADKAENKEETNKPDTSDTEDGEEKEPVLVSIVVIEGDSQDQVRAVRYDIGDPDILGYAEMPEEIVEVPEQPEEPAGTEGGEEQKTEDVPTDAEDSSILSRIKSAVVQEEEAAMRQETETFIGSANDVNDGPGTSNTIESLRLEWTTTLSGGGSVSNFSTNGDRTEGTLTPSSSNTSYTSAGRRAYAFANLATGGDRGYEPGDIEIRIPLWIFRDRDTGELDGVFNPPADLAMRGLAGRYDYENGEYVVTNVVTVLPAAYISLQFDYQITHNAYSPNRTEGGKTFFYPADIVDNVWSDETAVKVKLKATEDITLEQTSNPIKCKVDTNATMNYAYKYYSTRYNSWPSQWGEKPEGDGDDYFYIEWYAYYSGGYATQPFTAYINDSVNSGELVRSALGYSGLSSPPRYDSHWYTPNTPIEITNYALASNYQHGSYNDPTAQYPGSYSSSQYICFLTKHKKGDYKNGDKIRNTFTAHGVKKDDGQSMGPVTSYAEYTYKDVNFVMPPGNYGIFKWNSPYTYGWTDTGAPWGTSSSYYDNHYYRQDDYYYFNNDRYPDQYIDYRHPMIGALSQLEQGVEANNNPLYNTNSTSASFGARGQSSNTLWRYLSAFSNHLTCRGAELTYDSAYGGVNDLAAYGHHNYTVELIDDMFFMEHGLGVENGQLTADDYELQYCALGNMVLINSVDEVELANELQFRPRADTNTNNYPPVDLYVQVSGGEWTKYGTWDFTNVTPYGSVSTRSPGSTSSTSGSGYWPRSFSDTSKIAYSGQYGILIALPENCTAVKAVATTTALEINYTLQVCPKLKPSAKVVRFCTDDEGQWYARTHLYDINTLNVIREDGTELDFIVDYQGSGAEYFKNRDLELYGGARLHKRSKIALTPYTYSGGTSKGLFAQSSGTGNSDTSSYAWQYQIYNNRMDPDCYQFEVAYRLYSYEMMSHVGMEEDYLIETGSFIPQTQGVFYDLLPEGASFQRDSLSVRVLDKPSSISSNSVSFYSYGSMDPETRQIIRSGYYASYLGEELSDMYYTLTEYPNWRGSGRTLLKIEVNTPDSIKPYYYYDTAIISGYTVTFNVIYTYDDILTTSSNKYNMVAYESKNGDLYRGYGDGGYWSGDLGSWMTDLNGDGVSGNDAPKTFRYSASSVDLPFNSSAVSGLTKRVKPYQGTGYVLGRNEDAVGTENEVTAETMGGRFYSYRLRFATPNNIEQKDMIFYDVLENHYPDQSILGQSIEDRFFGIFQSVNVQQLREKGIEPVVYYSTVAGLEINETTKHLDAVGDIGRPIWHKMKLDDSDTDPTASMPADKADITAIAVDARKKADGSDYVMPIDEIVLVEITLLAPLRYAATGDEDSTKYLYAFNNAYMDSKQRVNNDTAWPDTSLLINYDYTGIKLKEIPHEITVSKRWVNEAGQVLDPRANNLTAHMRLEASNLRIYIKHDPYSTGYIDSNDYAEVPIGSIIEDPVYGDYVKFLGETRDGLYIFKEVKGWTPIHNEDTVGDGWIELSYEKTPTFRYVWKGNYDDYIDLAKLEGNLIGADEYYMQHSEYDDNEENDPYNVIRPNRLREILQEYMEFRVVEDGATGYTAEYTYYQTTVNDKGIIVDDDPTTVYRMEDGIHGGSIVVTNRPIGDQIIFQKVDDRGRPIAYSGGGYTIQGELAHFVLVPYDEKNPDKDAVLKHYKRDYTYISQSTKDLDDPDKLGLYTFIPVGKPDEEQDETDGALILPGTYWLVEWKAPDGYEGGDPIRITFTRDIWGEYSVSFPDGGQGFLLGPDDSAPNATANTNSISPFGTLALRLNHLDRMNGGNGIGLMAATNPDTPEPDDPDDDTIGIFFRVVDFKARTIEADKLWVDGKLQNLPEEAYENLKSYVSLEAAHLFYTGAYPGDYSSASYPGDTGLVVGKIYSENDIVEAAGLYENAGFRYLGDVKDQSVFEVVKKVDDQWVTDWVPVPDTRRTFDKDTEFHATWNMDSVYLKTLSMNRSIVSYSNDESDETKAAYSAVGLKYLTFRVVEDMTTEDVLLMTDLYTWYDNDTLVAENQEEMTSGISEGTVTVKNKPSRLPILIQKIEAYPDQDNPDYTKSVGLTGATFVLYTDKDMDKNVDGTVTVKETGATPIPLVYCDPGTDGSGANGHKGMYCTSEEVEPGVYWLVEETAPLGYHGVSAPIALVVDDTPVEFDGRTFFGVTLAQNSGPLKNNDDYDYATVLGDEAWMPHDYQEADAQDEPEEPEEPEPPVPLNYVRVQNEPRDLELIKYWANAEELHATVEVRLYAYELDVKNFTDITPYLGQEGQLIPAYNPSDGTVPVGTILDVVRTGEGEDTSGYLVIQKDGTWVNGAWEKKAQPDKEITQAVNNGYSPIELKYNENESLSYRFKTILDGETRRKIAKEMQNQVVNDNPEFAENLVAQYIHFYMLEKEEDNYTVVYEVKDANGNVVSSVDGVHPGIQEGDLTVTNTVNYTLPETGGAGTAGIYLIGAVLTCAGAAALILRRRWSH